MRKRVLILTGSPGIGKTTVLTKAVNLLKTEKISIGGMVSREVREGEVRIGFEIVDVQSDSRGWLAHVNFKAGPAVGKYHVNVDELEVVGAAAITSAVKACDVVVIDEIGPMELVSSKFVQAVRAALASGKPVIVVVHRKTTDKLAADVRCRPDAETFVVTFENRNSLAELIAERVMSLLQGF